MDYRLVFDVIEAGNRHFWFPVVGVGFILLSAVLFQSRELLPSRSPRWLPYFLLIISVSTTIISGIATIGEHSRLATALRENRCAIVEGVVTEFRPIPRGGKGSESFVVDSQRFEYSDHVLSAGYNQTSARGGEIRQGLMVKIWHLDGDIARLEIAD